MAGEPKAKQGRIDSHYSYKTINDEGVATVEANVVVRDQSPESASKALIGAMEGIASPAREQVEGTK